MTYDAETTTKPDNADANSSSEAEEMRAQPNPAPVLEETGGKPAQEEANTEPDQEQPTSEPEYEKIKPPIDLNEIFDFEGGYGNPPRSRQFRKGTSGNPGGRPLGSKNKPKPLNDENLTEILQSEYYKEVRVNGGQTISAARAITRRLVDQAIGGDLRAIKLALTSLHAADAAVAAQQEAEYNHWKAYVDRLKNDPMRILYDSRRPVPHPKDIIFDHINKRVLQTGPRNEEEMLEKLAEKNFQEKMTDEEEEESENVDVADECPEELRCPPRSYSWNPDKSEEPRLRTPSPDDREDERLRKPAPDEREEDRLRKPAPDEPEEERLRKPGSDELEDARFKKPTP